MAILGRMKLSGPELMRQLRLLVLPILSHGLGYPSSVLPTGAGYPTSHGAGRGVGKRQRCWCRIRPWSLADPWFPSQVCRDTAGPRELKERCETPHSLCLWGKGVKVILVFLILAIRMQTVQSESRPVARPCMPPTVPAAEVMLTVQLATEPLIFSQAQASVADRDSPVTHSLFGAKH